MQLTNTSITENNEINDLVANILVDLGCNQIVNAAVIYGNYLYVAGQFTSFQGEVRQRVAKINLSTKTVDTDFNSSSGFNNVVRALAISPDGNTLYCGGTFTSYNGIPRQFVAALNTSDASLNDGFDSSSGFGNIVYALAINPDGDKLYCGGNFFSYKGIPRQRIAALNTSDASLNDDFDSSSGFNSIVYALAISPDGNTLYCGGDFTSYKGIPRQFVSALNTSNASLDLNFDSSSGFSGGGIRALAISPDDNTLYCGGTFTSYKLIPRQRIAALNTSDATLNPNFSSGFDNAVSALAISSDGNKLYCGGDFTSYNGIPRQRIAALNTSDDSFDLNFDSSSGFSGGGISFVSALAISPEDSKLYCGGNFTSYKNKTVLNIAPLDIDTATTDAGMFSINFSVNAAVIYGNYLYVAGQFTSFQGEVRQRVAKINLSTKTVDTDFNSSSGFNNTVSALAISPDGNTLYCGGDFTSYNGIPRQFVAALNTSDASLNVGFNSSSGFNNTVFALAISPDGNKLYCGGSFTSYKLISRVRIAALNTSDASLNDGFNSSSGFGNTVFALAISPDGDKLYCGGNFTSYKGIPRQFVAALNSSNASLNDGFDSSSGFGSAVSALAISPDGDKLYCGGSFTSYNGIPRQRIAALNTIDASLNDGFNSSSGFDNVVSALAISSDGNKLYCGGNFFSYKEDLNNKYLMELSAYDASYENFVYTITDINFIIEDNELRANKVFSSSETPIYYLEITQGARINSSSFSRTFTLDILPAGSINLPASTIVINGKVVATVSGNPTLKNFTFNNLPLQTNSVLRNSEEGGKKYLKIDGDIRAFNAIPITPPLEWNWSEEGEEAWEILQNK